MVYLITLIYQTNQQEGRSTHRYLYSQHGGQMFIALGMHVSPVESGKSRMHKYHSTARLVEGGEHRPRGTMLQRQSEALNTGPKRYSPLHCTRNSYSKRKETTVYTCKRLWSEKMNKGGGAMHWKGLPVYSLSSSSPPSPQSHLGSRKTLKSPAWYPSWPPGPLWAGRYPTAKNT